MSRKKSSLDLKSVLAGAALGAGVASYIAMKYSQDPYHTLSQKRRDRALTMALEKARQDERIVLGSRHRIVIFSDMHKGTGNLADSFRQCRETYLAALDHYHQDGFTLVVLGDAEELWEEAVADVIQHNRDILQSEARFYPERYYRLTGNHDNAWEDLALVRQYLDEFFPGIVPRRAMLLEYSATPSQPAGGEILLAHGHQGTLDSDFFDFVPPLVLPLYRDFQNLTNFGRTAPSRDDCLRSLQDNQMYRWVSRQARLILIAGHTHRPIWSSMSHLERLVAQLNALLNLAPEDQPPDYDQQLSNLVEEIRQREQKYPPCNDTIKTRPSYFNTGCCIFEDGDITGIEIQDGRIRLIKWGLQAQQIVRTSLEEAPLAEIFARL
jgi:UDP-2,3-diacylglucosamine pyrophosphatase LpxH